MKILRQTTNQNLLINSEQDFRTDLGWEENLMQFEDEVLNQVINPIENYDTVRYIHQPYTFCEGATQSDIWFYFYFLTGTTYVQDYTAVNITPQENEHLLPQSTKSFFRLELFKTPNIFDTNGNVVGYESPTRVNRKLVFAKNLSLPNGEKFFLTTLNGYIHVPIFTGSNYRNKENMYMFWFADESVLTETNLSGTTTGTTFFMTAKFYDASTGDILDFTNDIYSSDHTINEATDMYYQVDFYKPDRTYVVYKYNGTKGDRIGTTSCDSLNPIKFYEKGGGNLLLITPTPTPTPSSTSTTQNTPTPTPTPTSTPPNSYGLYSYSLSSGSTYLEACSNHSIHTDTYWINNGGSLQIGNSLCQNANCLTPALDGYYSDGTNWYQVSGGAGAITFGGSCTQTEITTITVGGAHCRIMGSCSDNGTCAMRFSIVFANGRPAGSQITINEILVNNASVGITIDDGTANGAYLDYTENNNAGSITFKLTLKTLGGSYICDSGNVTLSHQSYYEYVSSC
jgi:hypothetical protein